jgi:S1-C subfamily serine protease
MGLRLSKLVLSVVPILLGVAGGWVGYQYLEKSPQSVSSSNSNLPSLDDALPIVFSQTNQAKSLPQDPQNPNFIAAVVELAGPAVVRIDATRKSIVEGFAELDREGENPSGVGSGFILTGDGKILTNAHVVQGAKSVEVTFDNGEHLQGEIIGIDRPTDIAVIKVKASKNLPTVKIGNSQTLQRGEWAIAIGNPLGLDHTVTVGIISALDRTSSEVGISDKRVRFIQTDAAINPGNSGGPLLNARGEAIGINTAIRANGQGLGFAIPIQSAMKVAEQLVAKGKVSRPYLGIEMIPITPELLAGIAKEPTLRSKVKAKKGALIMKVVPASPADTAGIRPGDAIVKVANRSIANPSDVQEQIDASPIGRTLLLEISRDGKTESISIVPTSFPELDAELDTGRN